MSLTGLTSPPPTLYVVWLQAHAIDNPREPVVFWSKDTGNKGASTSGVDVDSSFRDREQLAEGAARRSEAKSLLLDKVRGASLSAYSTESDSNGRESSVEWNVDVSRESVPGLEFGTVRHTRNRHSYDRDSSTATSDAERVPRAATFDSGMSKRPHLLITGSHCGRFADHSALDGRC
jgi:hypothetical protein